MNASRDRARTWLQAEVDQCEALIAEMPPEKQDEYRALSEPHNALAEFNALWALAESRLELLRIWAYGKPCANPDRYGRDCGVCLRCRSIYAEPPRTSVSVSA